MFHLVLPRAGLSEVGQPTENEPVTKKRTAWLLKCRHHHNVSHQTFWTQTSGPLPSLPWQLQPVQIASIAVAARLKVQSGALVQAVLAGSAAEKAGLLATRRGLSGIIAGGWVGSWSSPG